MVDIGQNYYGVVVSTNLYAGNFERQLTAYCTGRVGECGVGDRLMPLFMQDFYLDEQDCDADPFWDALDFVPDEHGCVRPCTIYPGKDGKYNDVLMFFQEKPTKKQVDIILERAKKYSTDGRIKELSDSAGITNRFDAQPNLQILGVHVLRIATTITMEEASDNE